MIITKKYVINSIRLLHVCRKFSISFNDLAQIATEYIKTGQYEIYSLRLNKLVGSYEPFVKQEISDLMNEAIESYRFIGSVTEVTITEARITMTYEDEDYPNENESDNIL